MKEKKPVKKNTKNRIRQLFQKGGIFFVSALIVLCSTILLRSWIYVSRAASKEVKETATYAAETEKNEILVPEGAGIQAEEVEDMVDTRETVYNRENFLDPLPAYALEYESWEGAEDTLGYVTEEHVTMEQVGEIAVNVAHFWFGAPVEDAIVRIHFSPTEQENVEEEEDYEWVVSLYTPDWSTKVFVVLDAESGQIRKAHIAKEHKKYFIEDRTQPDAALEYAEEPDYLQEEDYDQAVKDCGKLAAEFLQGNILTERSIKKIETDHAFAGSEDADSGGNRIRYTLHLNDGGAYELEYLAFGNGDRELSRFVEY